MWVGDGVALIVKRIGIPDCGADARRLKAKLRFGLAGVGATALLQQPDRAGRESLWVRNAGDLDVAIDETYRRNEG